LYLFCAEKKSRGKLIMEISLREYNTFGFDVKAQSLYNIKGVKDLDAAFKELGNQKRLILGGGSNLLLLSDFEGAVIKIEIKGIELLKENEEHIWIKVGAGEIWHDLVQYCIEQNWAGIENLSLIPGTVGAAPMQNIGAYGVEIKDVFHSLEAYEIATGELKVFNAEECTFGYRESFFKHKGKDKYVICNVSFRLHKKPIINTKYGVINDTLLEMGVSEPGIKEVSEAVIKIRRSKLPDPAEIGNSGSFFKNPEISKHLYNQVAMRYPNIPSYAVDADTVKVPAGWLIEQCGWKGHRRGNVGVHEKQALVLVHYGGGKGSEIKALAEEIQASVREKYGIEIKPEVNFI
jgi:UDP-N-acetylmuramate dehydrogenase